MRAQDGHNEPSPRARTRFLHSTFHLLRNSSACDMLTAQFSSLGPMGDQGLLETLTPASQLERFSLGGSMKTTTLFLCAAILLCAAMPAAFGQEERQKLPTLTPFTTAIPARNLSLDDVTAAANAGTGLAVWTTTLSATKDGLNYTVTMVGQDPSTSTGTTNIPTVIIPVIIKIGTTTFNPTVADTTCMVAPNNVPSKVFKQSPLFANHAFIMNGVNEGSTQYIDAFQRANLATLVASTYHTKLSTITMKPAQTFVVPAGSGSVNPTSGFGNGGCGPNKNPAGMFGIMDINAFDPWVTGTALPHAAVTPNQLPILLLYDVLMSVGAPTINDCCILGYHGALNNGQTSSPMEFDQTGIFGPKINDTSISAHEIGEWMDDPFANNATPAWGGIGQVSGCQGNLEDGDPLTGTHFPPVTMSSNHYKYHLQELAFRSWYYNSQFDPSIGAGGKFSNNGKFGGPSKVCPPGGT